MVYFADRHHHAVPLFIDANILRLNFLYYESVANLMYDIKNNIAPINILNLFEKTANIHSYDARSSANGHFYVKSSRLEIHKRSFSRFGVKLWNEIPCHIRDLPKKTFKTVLHRLLLKTLEKEKDYSRTSPYEHLSNTDSSLGPDKIFYKENLSNTDTLLRPFGIRIREAQLYMKRQ